MLNVQCSMTKAIQHSLSDHSPVESKNEQRTERWRPAGWTGCVSLPAGRVRKCRLVTKRCVFPPRGYQGIIAITFEWQRDAATPAGGVAIAPLRRGRRI